MTEAPLSPKALLVSHGLRPKRQFGQNFLADARLAARIAEVATTPAGGTVVEIGAGTGALTRPLLQRAARVVAIERDRDLVPVLAREYAPEIEAGRLALEEADAKQAPLQRWLESGPPPRVLAGNLPYQITGPLLERAIALADTVDQVVLLVQLEVANRLAAAPGSDSYGALSVFAQARFEIRRELVVRRGAFYPQPGVDSALVVLTPRRSPLAVETDAFRAVVKAAFAQRRKKLRNAWRGVMDTTPEQLGRAADRAGIDLDVRGETLGVEDFRRMAEEVSG
jgi:16S rRNA (adenine1518-N6/adenine1519-N6)-dimethyltransferase